MTGLRLSAGGTARVALGSAAVRAVERDYGKLDNKPSVEGHELSGDSALEDIGLVPLSAARINEMYGS